MIIIIGQKQKRKRVSTSQLTKFKRKLNNNLFILDNYVVKQESRKIE